jgi:hypothetical protein
VDARVPRGRNPVGRVCGVRGSRDTGRSSARRAARFRRCIPTIGFGACAGLLPRRALGSGTDSGQLLAPGAGRVGSTWVGRLSGVDAVQRWLGLNVGRVVPWGWLGSTWVGSSVLRRVGSTWIGSSVPRRVGSTWVGLRVRRVVRATESGRVGPPRGWAQRGSAHRGATWVGRAPTWVGPSSACPSTWVRSSAHVGLNVGQVVCSCRPQRGSGRPVVLCLGQVVCCSHAPHPGMSRVKKRT